jgi:hypothetical protein
MPVGIMSRLFRNDHRHRFDDSSLRALEIGTLLPKDLSSFLVQLRSTVWAGVTGDTRPKTDIRVFGSRATIARGVFDLTQKLLFVARPIVSVSASVPDDGKDRKLREWA